MSVVSWWRRVRSSASSHGLGLEQHELLIQGLEHLSQGFTDQRVIVDNQNLQTSSLDEFSACIPPATSS